jgi:hypothetical protein
MDEDGEYYAKWNKPGTQVPCSHLYIKSLIGREYLPEPGEGRGERGEMMVREYKMSFNRNMIFKAAVSQSGRNND